jgi:hypothetical protein
VLELVVSATAEVVATLPAEITESSGMATASSGDTFYTHEDSGAPPQFFAVSLAGELLATYTLAGVDARDWEDMARAQGSLFFADIGDNRAARDRGVLVHQVPEPTTTDDAALTPTSFRLRYDDGPHDAEAVLVHPRTGRIHVVTKLAADVYAAPEQLDPTRPNALTRVGEASVRSPVTGGDIAPDGSRVALRTYTALYEWPLDGDDVGAALAGEPVITPLPTTQQGEAVTYIGDGTAVLITTEGENAPVHRVPAAAFDSSQEADDGVRWWPVVVGVGVAALAMLLALGRRRSTSR